MPELHRKTLGIIGLGRIGGTLAAKAVHLFEKVIAYDPYITPERFDALSVQQVSLDELCALSDVISCHCNLTEETTSLVDQQAFEKMKKKPIVVNTARGPVVSTSALLDALNAGQIQAAGIDVFNAEIPREIPSALLSHPGIIATGHYAWYSENSSAELQRRAALNMVGLLKGNNVDDVLN
jgi:D-3-phosphoglycerate dehydrogenase